MSTDTPRTDNMLGKLLELGHDLHTGSCPEVLVTEMRKMEVEMKGLVDQWTADRADLIADARKLERELAEARSRIARLVEAGGAMCRQLKDERGTENDWQERSEQAIEDWRKAKL